MKFAAIADWADSGEYGVRFMCRQLKVSTSGYYAWRSRPVSDHAKTDAVLDRLIRALHESLRGNPGVRRIHAGLVAAGHHTSRKRVWRLMQAAGLAGRHPRAWKRTTVPGAEPQGAPDLIGRDFTAAEANQRWCGDF